MSSQSPITGKNNIPAQVVDTSLNAGQAIQVLISTPAAKDEAAAGGYSTKQKNKYVGGIDHANKSQETVDPSIDHCLLAAGVPVPSTALIENTGKKIKELPKEERAFIDHKISDLAINMKDGNTKEATKNVTTLATTAANVGLNPWALIIVALKGSAKNQQEQTQYDMSKLKIFNEAEQKIADYMTNVLEPTQLALENAMNAQTDSSKKSSIQVPLQDNNGNATGTQNFTPLDDSVPITGSSDGSDNPATAIPANVKLTHYVNGKDNSNVNMQTIQINGITYSMDAKGNYTGPDGKPCPYKILKYDANGNPDPTSLNPKTISVNGQMYDWNGDSSTQSFQPKIDNNGNTTPDTKSASPGSSSKLNMIDASGLSNLLQTTQSQKSLLDNSVQKWTNQYQSDYQTLQSIYTMITGILKSTSDMVNSVSSKM